MCGYFAAKGSRIHVVDKCAFAVDLYDRKPLAILRLQPWIPADVDLVEFEIDLLADLFENRARAFAEMAALRVEENDLRLVRPLTDRCRA